MVSDGNEEDDRDVDGDGGEEGYGGVESGCGVEGDRCVEVDGGKGDDNEDKSTARKVDDR